MSHHNINKCFFYNTPILKSDSTIVPIENLKVGDKLIGEDSCERVVTSISSGDNKLYKINYNKSDPYIVSQDHILVLKALNCEGIWKDENKKRYRIRWLEKFSIKEKLFPFESYVNIFTACIAAQNYLKYTVPQNKNYIKCDDTIEIKVKDYIALPKRIQNVYKVYSVSLMWPEKNLILDPYIMGYWLGSRLSTNTYINLVDDEIIEYVNHYAYNNNLMCSPVGIGKYTLSNSNLNLEGILKKYDLITNKHIPCDYLMSSIDQRRKLLAGLIDSDGCTDKTQLTLSLNSEKLVDNIIFLARSMGLSAHKKQCIVIDYKNTNNNNPLSGLYWICYIYGDGIEYIPSLIKYNRSISKKKGKKGIEIEELGIGKCYGFSIDKESNFLLSDFTISRNNSILNY
jgi:hypothetical protein